VARTSDVASRVTKNSHPNRGPIQPPPAGSDVSDDRDDTCADAIAPHLHRLIYKASTAGWSEAEILTAILSLIATGMRRAAGDAATRETLSQVIFQLDD